MFQTVHRTKYFKDIFPTFEDFASWYKSTALSDGDAPAKKTFTIISYEYNDCHVAFDDENFKEHFAIDLYTFYKEFEATSATIDKLMALTDEDVSLDSQMITNIANIPETASSTDVESVDFVTTQQKMMNKKGKQSITREQLGNKRAYTTRAFLKRFRHLFITVYDSPYTAVIKENQED